MKGIIETSKEVFREYKVLIIAVACMLGAFAVGVWLGTSLTTEQPEEKPEQVTQVVEIPCFQDSLDDWSTLQMAIVMTESKFNPAAKGKGEDLGILQITPIYTKEVNRLLKEDKYKHDDAFDINLSLEMFEAIQAYYNPEKDLNKAIKYHNKADWYAQRVKNNIVFIQRMEEVRRAILQNQTREQGIL